MSVVTKIKHFFNFPIEDIIMIPSQPAFALSPECCVLSQEATTTNFIVFGFTQPVLKPMIYCTRSEHTNHYTTDAVIFINENLITRNFLNIALTNVLIYGKLARCRVQRNPLQFSSGQYILL
jgi:hypothetical protein